MTHILPLCSFWKYGAGLPLAPCNGPWWLWGAPSLHGPLWWGPWGGPQTHQAATGAAALPVGGGAVGSAAPGLVGGGPVSAGGVPMYGTLVAGLGAWSPSPAPGAVLATPVGPLGLLGTATAELAGPGVPQAFLQGPGVPGAPIVPGSAGTAGEPIGP